MLKNKVFLIVGEDFSSRKHAIESIKKKLARGRPSVFQVSTIYSDQTDLNGIKELLFTSSFGGERIVIFKDITSLDKEIKDFLYKNLNTVVSSNYLIMEIEFSPDQIYRDKRFTADKLLGYLLKYARIIRIRSFPESVSIKKLIFSLRDRKLDRSLYILEKIFSDTGVRTDALAMMVLGSLSREFSRLRLPVEKERCFLLLWDTERALKEGRVPPKLALELLITKLILA